jgi:hypothetical protein
MDNTSDVKVITRPSDAKYLIKHNFQLDSIKADRHCPTKTIFVFRNRADVIAALDELYGN